MAKPEIREIYQNIRQITTAEYGGRKDAIRALEAEFPSMDYELEKHRSICDHALTSFGLSYLNARSLLDDQNGYDTDLEEIAGNFEELVEEIECDNLMTDLGTGHWRQLSRLYIRYSDERTDNMDPEDYYVQHPLLMSKDELGPATSELISDISEEIESGPIRASTSGRASP